MGRFKPHLFHDAWGAFEDALRRVYGAVVSTAHQDGDAGLDAAGKRSHIDLPKMWKRLADITKTNGSPHARVGAWKPRRRRNRAESRRIG
jgi:hypothetical protein